VFVDESFSCHESGRTGSCIGRLVSLDENDIEKLIREFAVFENRKLSAVIPAFSLKMNLNRRGKSLESSKDRKESRFLVL